MSTSDKVAQDNGNISSFVLAIAGITAALYYGQAMFRPLALGLLLAVLLTASTEALRKYSFAGLRMKNWMAMSVSILILILGLLLVVHILSGQANDLSQIWPRYVERFEAMLAKLAHWLNKDIADQIKQQFSNLDLSSSVSIIASKTGSILADIVMTGLYAAFMLTSQKAVSRKLTILFPKAHDHNNVTQVMRAAAHSIRKYVLIKTVMSVVTGLVSYAVLKVLGVDFAETWALLIFLLNYIPTVGSIIGVVFPAVLALLQFDTFGPFLIIAIMLTGVQFTIGNVIEPIFMGRVLNLSSLAVIVALSLWGSMWGIVGMFMSVPITVVIMIFCSHISRLQWIAVLLSEDGKLASEASIVVTQGVK